MTKFCLHAEGGIYVRDNFEQLEGKIEVSNSSAQYRGGAVLRSSSWGLWQDFEMAVGYGRSTLGSANRKRIEEISVDFHKFHQRWRQSLIGNWFKS